MTTTLLTFLGRVPSNEKGYRTTSYDFGDGTRTEPVAFFGWPLQQRLEAERLVIMGTAGSMWDHLFEKDISFGQEAEARRIRLMEAVEKKAVTADLLAPLEHPLSQRLVLIPYCRDEQEQIELLSIMARHVESGDTVHIDVSHGFRHLPMIALLAALHLRLVRQAQIGGIWYGAYDPESGEAPVYDLRGLLRITDWIQALHTYDKDGDYGAFQPLLGPAGDLLVQAAFFERTSNPVRARQALASWAGRADRFPEDDPAAELFRQELEQRVCWYRLPDRAAWETELAQRYLQQGDYVRAAIYGLEAVISAEGVRSGRRADIFKQRELIRENLKSTRTDFLTLNNLRNALAHGVRPRNESIQHALENEANLQEALKNLLARLLNPQPKQAT